MISVKTDPDRLLSSWEVGDLLQVNPSSINKWVKDGRIPAFRTPGGHRRIRVSDLVQFLDAHKMPIPKALTATAVERRRVLVVDDNEPYLRSLSRLLKSHEERLEVRLVDNGIDALVLVGSFRPDVIVLDVFMPGVDGIEVCRRLKERNDTAFMDVIVTSGSLTEEIERRALAAGARRCFSKPLDLKILLAEIEVEPPHAQP